MNPHDNGAAAYPRLQRPPQDAVMEAWQMLAGVLEAARVMPPRLRAADDSLPLTIISGFLGSGKTTLLNRLLSEPGGRRLAVLVNDFGRINIDAALVRARTEDMISLANGCVCCTVSTEMTRTLIDLSQREIPPDAVVIEASGLADPRGIAQVALSNPAMRLDGILTLVDAQALAQPMDNADSVNNEAVHATWARQLDAADLLVLTKTDAVSARVLAGVRAQLAQAHPHKPVIEAVHGHVPPELVLGLHSRQDPRQAPAATWDHSAAFDSCSLHLTQPLDQARLERFLSSLPAGLLRAKGVLHLAQAPQLRHVFQQVGPRTRLLPEAAWGPERPASSLVLIGPKGSLDEAVLQQAFGELAYSNHQETAHVHST